MRHLSAVLFDRGYVVPTLVMDVRCPEDEEDGVARGMLAHAPFCLAIELRDGDARVAGACRDERPEPAAAGGDHLEGRGGQ